MIWTRRLIERYKLKKETAWGADLIQNLGAATKYVGILNA